MASAGNKRGRSAWEDCEDVRELKGHLSKQYDQIESLRKEKADLTKALKLAEGQAPEETPEELNAQAKAVLGEHLASKAKNGPKKMEVTADGDDLETVFPCGFSKSLRYGACLELNKGIKFSYEKTTSNLKLTATCSMVK